MHTNQHTSLARIHTHGERERSGAEHHTHQHSCFSQESPVFNIHLPPLPVLLFLPANSRNLYGPSLVISYEYSNQYYIPRLSSCQILYEMHHLTKSTQYTHFKPFVTSTWQPIMSAVDFCTDSRHGKLDLASVVEMEGEESGGAFSEQPYNLEMKILCQRVFYLSPWHLSVLMATPTSVILHQPKLLYYLEKQCPFK